MDRTYLEVPGVHVRLTYGSSLISLAQERPDGDTMAVIKDLVQFGDAVVAIAEFGSGASIIRTCGRAGQRLEGQRV